MRDHESDPGFFLSFGSEREEKARILARGYLVLLCLKKNLTRVQPLPFAQDLAEQRRASRASLKWKSAPLMHAVLASRQLRNKAALAASLKQAIALLLPKKFQAVALAELEQRVPSAATIRRAEADLDAAYMGYWRSVIDKRQPPLLYCWADASPQGGREWLVSSYLVIEQADIMPLYRASMFLLPLRRRSCKRCRGGAKGLCEAPC